jgi:hypothetical protein
MNFWGGRNSGLVRSLVEMNDEGMVRSAHPPLLVRDDGFVLSHPLWYSSWREYRPSDMPHIGTIEQGYAKYGPPRR